MVDDAMNRADQVIVVRFMCPAEVATRVYFGPELQEFFSSLPDQVSFVGKPEGAPTHTLGIGNGSDGLTYTSCVV